MRTTTRIRPALAFLPVALLFSLNLMGMGRSPQGYTLIVAPDSPYTLQVSHDVSQHYPVLLVSYESPGNPAEPFLHVLHDGTWKRVPAAQFANGSFLTQRPTRTIVVGDDNAMTESLINVVQGWSAQVINHPASNTTELLNAYGQDFQFSKGQWRWFASKYNLQLDNLNSDSHVKSWYDQPYVDETKGGRMTGPVRESTPRLVAPSEAAKPAPMAPREVQEPEIRELEPAPQPSAPPQFRGWNNKN